MALTFAQPIQQKKLTAGQHVDKLGALADKLAPIQRRSPSEIDATWERDRAIGRAFGRARNMSTVKLPDGVVLTPEELELAEWVYEYAAHEKLPVKEAMGHIFDYLKRNPDQMAEYTKGDASFSESLAGLNGLADQVQQDEWKACQSALGHLRRIHLYQTVAGCSFSEAVGAVA
ncbi:MAG TPA: hypothetical protein VMV97_03085 [Sulfuriferula sp.]|nr:hypothetical protein [Sulfuriferula sp.]